MAGDTGQMNNGPDDKKPGDAGREQRPYATLDLKAEDVSPASDASENKDAPSGAAGHESPREPLRIGMIPGAETGTGLGEVTAASLATHLCAGAFGAAIVLALGYSLLPGAATPPPANVDAAALRAEIATANQKVAALEAEYRKTAASLAALQSGSGAADGLKREVTGLGERLAAIEARPPTPAAPPEQAIQHSIEPLAMRLAKAEERIDGVAKAQSEIKTDSKGPALALALYNLRRAANDGKPFSDELKTVSEMSPVALDLGVLEGRRDRGIPSLGQIRAGFETASNAALDAENQPSDDSFLAGAWARAKSLVRVKRKGDIAGDSTLAVLARTEHRLEAGELRNALAEAETLHGPAKDALAPWITELKAKIAADEALAKAEATLLTALGRDEAAKRGG
jgi:hypothetical protein